MCSCGTSRLGRRGDMNSIDCTVLADILRKRADAWLDLVKQKPEWARTAHPRASECRGIAGKLLQCTSVMDLETAMTTLLGLSV